MVKPSEFKYFGDMYYCDFKEVKVSQRNIANHKRFLAITDASLIYSPILIEFLKLQSQYGIIQSICHRKFFLIESYNMTV